MRLCIFVDWVNMIEQKIGDIIIDKKLLRLKQIENKANGKLRQRELDRILKKEILRCRKLTQLTQD